MSKGLYHCSACKKHFYDAEATQMHITDAHKGKGDILRHPTKRELLIQADIANARIAELEAAKDGAYEERNRLVALIASLFPSGTARTNIPGWSDDWHGCVYIDFPWGQASWHFHDSQSALFKHLPLYQGEWDGHTNDEKYQSIARAAIREEPPMTNKDEDALKFLADEGQKCDRVDALRELLEKVVAAYDASFPMRTADYHVQPCLCLRCAVDEARASLIAEGE
jgi:hypothetical protein